MDSTIFVSYAWTSHAHREWVRLLASELKAIGFKVLIDAEVSYGESLTEFMRSVESAGRVLMIVDENYVERANTLPTSGVGYENKWIREAAGSHSSSWVAVLAKDNPDFLLPAWIAGSNPKSFDFNADPTKNDFPNSQQIEELWRWAEDLPAVGRDELSPRLCRERAVRLERLEIQRAPINWTSPSLTGEKKFFYLDAPNKTFRWGHGTSSFALQVSGCGRSSLYVYSDPIKGVGILRHEHSNHADIAAQISPGRTVIAEEGQTAILMNTSGALALVHIDKVQAETTGEDYTAPFVHFRWEYIEES